ncbi:MAG: GNAT family N-acetyltransferase [Alphaproteobacteria bacterium]|nr:GNAT family N-acetyltransferase [Alphaproteobacteria bacterium]
MVHDSLRRGTMFAYETDGEMVGLVGIFAMQPGNLKHRAVLFGLYVKPEYRKGIASTLVEHVRVC